MKRAEDLFAALKGKLDAPAGDWRAWPREDVGTGEGGKGDGTLNGLPYNRPIRPAAFLDAYSCVRELGEAVIIPLLSPDVSLDEAYLARFRALAVKANFETHKSPGLVYPVLAFCLLEVGSW